jgi:N,N'-diacetyllegionaminate synthase
MTATFEFCGKMIGTGLPPWIVAEIGLNHNGDVELARRMILSAKENGADAVKLQTFIAEEMISKKVMAEDPDHPGITIPFFEFFKRFELKREEYEELFRYARELDVPLFSAPFDTASLQMLEDLNCPAYKIASPDLTWLDFLRQTARLKKPIILSTGASSLQEVEKAVAAIRGEGNGRIVTLHCVSHYPAERKEMNLNCLPIMREHLQTPVGLSDHTEDMTSALSAIALGAVMIEKHFTLNRNSPGVDQALSIEPDELRALKSGASRIFETLGSAEKSLQNSEIPVKRSARRSLTARVDIAAGSIIKPEMISVKRPGTGIPPEEMEQLIGCRTRTDITAEETIVWDSIESPNKSD